MGEDACASHEAANKLCMLDTLWSFHSCFSLLLFFCSSCWVEQSCHKHLVQIFGIDVNPAKFDRAKSWGVDECINPTDHEDPIQVEE